MEVDLLLTEGLGDNSYLLVSGQEAAAVDPQRDVGRLLEAAAARKATIRTVLETHVHNDYVSGAAELRAATGATVFGPAAGGYAGDVRPVRDGDEIAVGDATLVALATAGHTFEHTAYLLRDPPSLFSGGSLIVGSAGRTDLLGPDHTDELTRLQHGTMRRIAELADDVALLPTHGAGSFCATSPPGDRRTSSIGAERAANPALAPVDVETFARQQLAGLVRYPRYYASMAPINRAGPAVFGDVPIPPPSSADEVARFLGEGGWLVDARPGSEFAASHVPRALNVPLEASFASYVGWIVPFGAPLALVVPDGAALLEAATQLFRIGYEAILGYLDGGVGSWEASGRAVGSYPAVSVAHLVRELERGEAGDVVDVRQRSEWDAGHLDGTRHVFVGDVPDRVDAFDPARVTTVVCASGYRASMAASILDRAGLPVRPVTQGGVPRALRLRRSA